MRKGYGAEIRRRRAAAGLSLTQLALAVPVDRSYLSRVETGARWPTAAVAKLLDEALDARGALIALWRAADAGHQEAADLARRVSESQRTSSDFAQYLADLPMGDVVTRTEATVARLAHAVVARLDPDERVVLVGRGAAAGASDLLKSLSPGSRLRKVPQDLLVHGVVR